MTRVFRKQFKKAIALLLVLIAVFSISGTGWQFEAHAACNCGQNPVIFIAGDTDIYTLDEDGNRVLLYDDGEYLNQILSEALPDAAHGVLTGDWDAYCEKVLNIFAPAYEHYAPDLEGNLPEESILDWAWRPEWIDGNRHRQNANVNVRGYEFRMDKRRSPLDIADDLQEFIECVRQKTGHDVVNIHARCLGPVALFAWLQKYERPRNYAGVGNVVIDATTAFGVHYGEAVMTGNVHISGESARIYLMGFENWREVDDGFNAELKDFLLAFVPALRESYGMELSTAVVNRLYSQLKDKFFAKFLKMYYVRQLAFMACIDKNWDEFIPYIFSEEGDDVTYAYYIEKLTEYHETVQNHIDDMLLELHDQGKINIIANYGFRQLYPLSEDCQITGDYYTGVDAMSRGATAAKVGETLSESYIAAREAEGKGAYISPDKQVDASTCLLPDNTFFLKNCDHEWPDQMFALATLLNDTPGADIHTFPQYCQFLNYDPDQPTLLPAQEHNANDMVYETSEEEKEEINKNFISKIVDLFNGLINKFLDFLYLILGPLGLMTKE